MTLIVSDNSPLNLFVRVGAAEVLLALFERVVTPSSTPPSPSTGPTGRPPPRTAGGQT
ncbi:MAG: hypothetical protein K2X87_04895 [Gemmataceae bacterium]|nr:hypothetical protein [Gemmataceae bacterium]